jgi:hypothetical protein
MAKQLEVCRFAPEIDSDSAVFSRWFHRCAHGCLPVIRSRKLRRHSGGNALQSQDHCAGVRVLPLKAMESSMKAWPSPHLMKTAISAIFVGMCPKQILVANS